MPTTATTKTMQCSLTQDELLARLEEHRATVNALRDLDEERKFAMRQFAERKKRLQAEEVRLDSVCNQKWENRDVDCLVEFHKPVVGQKTTIRTDTGELVAIEEMTDAEKQGNLFDEKAELEKIAGDIPPVSPYAKDAPAPEPAPAEENRITEAPPEKVVQTTEAPEIVGSCLECGKDVPKFALDDGKCAFCETKLPKCETCGGYLFDERTLHSFDKCVPRPRPAENSEETNA